MPAMAPATDAGEEWEDTFRHPIDCFSMVLLTCPSVVPFALRAVVRLT